jgi:hypothetical protein
MFGNVTFWLFWETGYDALTSLDDNGDGVLTGDDLKGLAIWHDANGNGICDPGEVKPLSEYGIVALSCRFERDPNHPGPHRVRAEWSDLPERQDTADVRHHPEAAGRQVTRPVGVGV